MKKRPEEHQRGGEQPDSRRRTGEVLEDSAAERRGRVAEVLETEPSEKEQGFLESQGVESLEALIKDADAVMGTLTILGSSDGLIETEVEPPLYGRILCALAAVPEYAQMIVESEEDHSFQDAIREMPKTKRPRYLEQLEKAVVIARATLEKQKERRKKKR